ncbi:hypothetical protein PC129_g15453 [Phytophthora cactorum]|nr:hypothetical protein Pcac1_g22296 [Phytophthora cactorum]KAG2804388.1 hypothetical protein PC111_g18284 [Phytophthora cactorum]KAG2804541.1 hypothetical protein PC112_g18675 [Phytophthora cactorum]KAG2850879.1 hypothetical protein PC113_g16392 [Phytophthora cactorum]KAG2887492.1 hypothetical protein PC114_g18810 [Phytophthora cactorum]
MRSTASISRIYCTTAVEACRNFEEHCQDFHRGQHHNSNYEDSPENELIRNRKTDTTDDLPQLWPLTVGESCDSDNESTCCDITGLPIAIFDYSIDSSLDSAREAICGTLNLPDIIDDVASQYCQRDIQSTPVAPAELCIDEYLLRATEGGETDDPNIFNGTTDFLNTFPTTRTQIDKFTECFAPVPW